VISGNDVEFRVLDGAAIPRGEWPALDALGAVAGPSIAGSRYLPEIVSLHHAATGSLDVAVATGCLAAGRGTLAGAAVLRAVAFSRDLDERARWLERSAADPRLSRFQCYFRSWAMVSDIIRAERGPRG
jgi:hypothetical protein